LNNKNEFKQQGGFAFPLLISMVHMWLKLLLSVLIVHKFSTYTREANSDPNAKKRVLVPWSVYLFAAVPVGVATALDIGASNASILFVSVPFYTVVKSSSIVFVLFFSILYRLQPFSWSLINATGVIVLGVIMASYGDPEFDLLGFVLVVSAAAVGKYLLLWLIISISYSI
jgi:solute carrier family 35 protein C2